MKSPFNIKRTYYQIIYVCTEEFGSREIPLVILHDGNPGYVINQWIYWLVRQDITPSSLAKSVCALCHLYALAISKHGDEIDESRVQGLVADFIDAKRYGTDIYCISADRQFNWLMNLGLNWQPIRLKSTIDSYLQAINKFDTWHSTFTKCPPLNPYDQRFLTCWEIYQDFKKTTSWDPLAYLHGARKHQEKIYKTTYKTFEHRRIEKAIRDLKKMKAFPPEKFVELVEKTENIRDKMLWLLMGGGSLRASETLNLYHIDIRGINMDMEARVALVDPVVGMIAWRDKNGRKHITSRQKYLAINYANDHLPRSFRLNNLQPRPTYSNRNNKLHAGWKGMTHSIRATHLYSPATEYWQVDDPCIIWIEPRIGQYFLTLFKKYQIKFVWNNKTRAVGTHDNSWPWHPWLFICLNKSNYGEPFSRQGIKRAWERAIKRIGMENCGLAPHSLRHMYGFYCANTLGLDLATTQAMMHHASIESTKVYYTLTADTVRAKINEAIISNLETNTDLSKFLIWTEKPRFNLSTHWR